MINFFCLSEEKMVFLILWEVNFDFDFDEFFERYGLFDNVDVFIDF